ncbi:MAG: class I SAM-dependent methyltransferase [Beijerinckiaceae bacterium]
MGSLYERYALPRLISCACGGKVFARQRRKVVPMAEGRVLEVGIGSGLNLPFYDPVRVESVTGVDPSAELRAMAEAAPRPDGLTVSVEAGAGERLPFADHSFDTLVCTYTLCSVGAVEAVLAEIRRVLKPGGSYLFCEHGLAPDASVARWQERLDPLWKRIAGNCHLSRPVAATIAANGFVIEETASMYLPGTPRFAGWNEWGRARVGSRL